MNQFAAIITKFQSTLPLVKAWIDNLLNANRNNAILVTNLNFPRIKQIFPPTLLEKSKVVYVLGKVPFPSLNSIGLSELSAMEEIPMAGITYKDTFLLTKPIKLKVYISMK
jgi:hypothetical protein